MEERTLLSVQFVFDYSLDQNRFFNTSAKKALLETAGRMLSERLSDSLSSIRPSGSNTWSAKFLNPATGSSTSVKNLSVASNTIVIYAGGRDLPSGTLAKGQQGGYSYNGSSSWGTTVKTRGQTGVTKGTDVAPWGGSITFDSRGVNWFFGATTNGLSGKTDFLSVAMHELGHVLGINSGNNSWLRYISGGRFTGPASMAENNNQSVGVDSGKGHWAEGTRSDEGIEAAMDPTLTTGTRKFFSRLDFAALKDIGWSVSTNNDTIYAAQHQLTQIPDPDLGTSSDVAFNGTIDNAKDVDVYRIYLGAGTHLSVRVGPRSGGRNLDTYLRLYDVGGSVLQSADQGDSGETDSIDDYTITRSDYYYVAVAAYSNRNYNPFRALSGPGGPVGDYRLVISAE